MNFFLLSFIFCEGTAHKLQPLETSSLSLNIKYTCLYNYSLTCVYCYFQDSEEELSYLSYCLRHRIPIPAALPRVPIFCQECQLPVVPTLVQATAHQACCLSHQRSSILCLYIWNSVFSSYLTEGHTCVVGNTFDSHLRGYGFEAYY